MSCRSIGWYRIFQGENDAESYQFTLVSWRWRQQVSTKRWYLAASTPQGGTRRQSLWYAAVLLHVGCSLCNLDRCFPLVQLVHLSPGQTGRTAQWCHRCNRLARPCASQTVQPTLNFEASCRSVIPVYIQAFWHVTSCQLVNSWQTFRRHFALSKRQ
jgi:hypothetical protein